MKCAAQRLQSRHAMQYKLSSAAAIASWNNMTGLLGVLYCIVFFAVTEIEPGPSRKKIFRKIWTGVVRENYLQGTMTDIQRSTFN